MDRTNEPAKFDLCHDVLHTLEGFVRSRAVVEKQQNSGEDLDHKKEQRDAAKEVPVRKPVKGNRLMAQRSDQIIPAEAIVQPVSNSLPEAHLRLLSCASRKSRRRVPALRMP